MKYKKHYVAKLNDSVLLLPELVVSDCRYEIITIDCDYVDIDLVDLVGLVFSKLLADGYLILKNTALAEGELSRYLGLCSQLGLTFVSNHGYTLSFKKSTSADYVDTHLRVSSPRKRTSQCLALFKNVFGEDMPITFWNWKYSRSSDYCISLLDKNTLKGFYGCTMRKLLVYGRVVEAFQPCDVMISKDSRGGMTKGAFSFLVDLYLSQFREKRAHLFGFPHKRQFLLAKRLGCYSEVDELVTLAIKCGNNVNLPVFQFMNFSLELLEESWDAMALSAEDFIILKKDTDYIQYRYLSHPCYSYSCVCVAVNGSIATLVFRKISENVVYLMDCIGSISEYSILIKAAVSYVGNHFPGSALVIWSLKTNYQLLLKDIRYEEIHDGARLVSSPWGTVNHSSGGHCRWIISMGDSEFL